MMVQSNFLAIFAVFTALATTTNLVPNPKHSLNLYDFSASVVSLFPQNPYFHLPNKPSRIVRGTDKIKVHVPSPKTMMMWDLSGWYLAPKSGSYTFDIEETDIATIQVVEAFESTKTNSKPFTFSYGPRKFILQSEKSYWVNIKYVGTIKPLDIYVTIPGGERHLLNESIMKEAPKPNKSTVEFEKDMVSDESLTSPSSTELHPNDALDLTVRLDAYSEKTALVPTSARIKSDGDSEMRDEVSILDISQSSAHSLGSLDRTIQLPDYSGQLESLVTGVVTTDDDKDSSHMYHSAYATGIVSTAGIGDTVVPEIHHVLIHTESREDLPSTSDPETLIMSHIPNAGSSEEISEEITPSASLEQISAESESENSTPSQELPPEFEVPDTSKMQLSKRGPIVGNEPSNEEEKAELQKNGPKPDSPHGLTEKDGSQVGSPYSGFHYKLYLALDESNPRDLLSHRSKLFSLGEGYLKATFEDPGTIEYSTPNAIEVLGYFDVPTNGTYTISKNKNFLGAVQIGPGYPTKSPVHEYTIGSDWSIFDTRVANTKEFGLQAGIFYPFRLIALAEASELDGLFGQTDPQGQNIDLLQLWQIEDNLIGKPSETHTRPETSSVNQQPKTVSQTEASMETFVETSEPSSHSEFREIKSENVDTLSANANSNIHKSKASPSNEQSSGSGPGRTIHGLQFGQKVEHETESSKTSSDFLGRLVRYSSTGNPISNDAKDQTYISPDCVQPGVRFSQELSADKGSTDGILLSDPAEAFVDNSEFGSEFGDVDDRFSETPNLSNGKISRFPPVHHDTSRTESSLDLENDEEDILPDFSNTRSSFPSLSDGLHRVMSKPVSGEQVATSQNALLRDTLDPYEPENDEDFNYLSEATNDIPDRSETYNLYSNPYFQKELAHEMDLPSDVFDALESDFKFPSGFDSETEGQDLFMEQEDSEKQLDSYTVSGTPRISKTRYEGTASKLAHSWTTVILCLFYISL